MPTTTEPGTIALYADIVCPWATVAVSRLRRARTEARLDGRLHIDHRLFLLEEVNREPVPKTILDAEMPVVADIEPVVGWQPWPEDAAAWPVSSLLANEAVHAAKAQGLDVSEELDWALRLAFFRDGRCITLLHEVLAVADGCPALDVDRLSQTLRDAQARGPMLRQMAEDSAAVQGSPHLFLGDGSDHHNPGIEIHWDGEPGDGRPIVDHDDPDVWADIVRRAVDHRG